MVQKRRGQAALEFLSTYGFAFLIILVMIGALTYFGVLNPKRLVPDGCVAGSEFSCNDFQVDRGVPATMARLDVRVVNQLGKSITVVPNQLVAGSPGYGTTATVAICGVMPASTGVNATGATVVTVAGGEMLTIACVMDRMIPSGAVNTANWPAVGEKVKVQLTIPYTEVGGAYAHTASLEVRAALR